MKLAEYERGFRIHTHSIPKRKEQRGECVWIRAMPTHNILSPSIKDGDRKQVFLMSALRVWVERAAINKNLLGVFLKDKNLHRRHEIRPIRKSQFTFPLLLKTRQKHMSRRQWPVFHHAKASLLFLPAAFEIHVVCRPSGRPNTSSSRWFRERPWHGDRCLLSLVVWFPSPFPTHRLCGLDAEGKESRVRVIAPEAGHGSALRWGAEWGDAAAHEVDLLASPSGSVRACGKGCVWPSPLCWN